MLSQAHLFMGGFRNLDVAGDGLCRIPNQSINSGGGGQWLGLGD